MVAQTPNTLRVLGLDTSLTHTGWQVWDAPYHHDGRLVSPGHYIEGGTYQSTPDEGSLVIRLAMMRQKIRDLLVWCRPEAVVIEGPLTHGQQRSTSGAALYAMVAADLHAAFAPPGMPVPRLVVTIAPSRLHAVVHGGIAKKMKAPQMKELYESIVYDPGTEGKAPPRSRRASEHEIDAYFLVMYGTRFLLTLVEKHWPMALLADREREAFLFSRKKTRQGDEVTTALMDQEGDAWWRNQLLQETVSA